MYIGITVNILVISFLFFFIFIIINPHKEFMELCKTAITHVKLLYV